MSNTVQEMQYTPERILGVARALARRFPPYLRDDLVGAGALAYVQRQTGMQWAMQDVCRKECVSRADGRVKYVPFDAHLNPLVFTERPMLARIDVELLLRRASPAEKAVISLGRLGYSVREIAERLHCTTNAVRKRFHYMRIRLRGR